MCICNLNSELVALIGEHLSIADQTSCFVAAKCFAPISYNTTECAMFIDRTKHYVLCGLKKRMPNLQCITLLIHDYDSCDASMIAADIRNLFPKIALKADISNCFCSSDVVATLPDDTEISVRNPSSFFPFNVSRMMKKRFSYLEVMCEQDNVLNCKELLDNVKEIKILWDRPLDLSKIDHNNTYVTLFYRGDNVSSLPHVDIYKTRKLLIANNKMIYAFSGLSTLFSNVKKNHGLLVDTVEIVASEYPVVKDQFITFIRILPETCRITIMDVYKTASLYITDILYENNILVDLHIMIADDYRAAAVIKLLSGRNHRHVFDPEFTDITACCSYKSLAEIWDDMDEEERCCWGFIRHIGH